MTSCTQNQFPLRLLTILALSLSGCATGASDLRSADDALAPIVDPPARAGAPSLLIAMPYSPKFADVRRTLVLEVQKNFNITTLAISQDTKVQELAAAIQAAKPVCLVLMNNSTMTLYHQYQIAHPEMAKLPAVLLMASLVEEARTKLRRTTGIAYEVPGVTAFVNLRTIINAPVNRVGVIYRPAFTNFLEHQKELATKEHIELVSVSISNNASAAEVRETLHNLATKQKVDAVWMLNDNGLIRDAEFIDEAWRSELAESKLPLIVGVPNLVEPSSPLGALAVVPDHEALGLQAANLIFDLSENDWLVEGHPIELPLSVKTVVDIKLVRANFGLRPDALKHIDKALE